MVLDFLIVISDVSPVFKNTLETPIHSRIVPTHSLFVSTHSRFVRHIPDSFRHIPDSFRHILESFRHIPDSFRHIPDSFRHIPDSTRYIPDSFLVLGVIYREWLDHITHPHLLPYLILNERAILSSRHWILH
jgi:hypothetical protein